MNIWEDSKKSFLKALTEALTIKASTKARHAFKIINSLLAGCYLHKNARHSHLTMEQEFNN